MPCLYNDNNYNHPNHDRKNNRQKRTPCLYNDTNKELISPCERLKVCWIVVLFSISRPADSKLLLIETAPSSKIFFLRGEYFFQLSRRLIPNLIAHCSLLHCSLRYAIGIRYPLFGVFAGSRWVSAGIRHGGQTPVLPPKSPILAGFSARKARIFLHNPIFL